MSTFDRIVSQMAFELPSLHHQIENELNRSSACGVNHHQTNQGLLMDDDYCIHLMASEDFGLILDGKTKEVHWVGTKKQDENKRPDLYDWHLNWRSRYAKL